MIQITLTDKRPLDPRVDDLGRSFTGYKAGMSEDEIWQHNRGCWVLGKRADREHYVLFQNEGTVIQAAEITGLTQAPKRPERRVIHGTVLTNGHPVYDTYVGRPAPVQRTRNPVTYFDAEVGQVPCRCGCGGTTTAGTFLPGHDQRALHERVARIGTVADFLDWFDDHFDGDNRP